MANVLFIQNLFYEYPGIMALSAMLKKHNISTDLIIEKNSQKILQYISQTKPKLICFSVTTGMHKFPILLSKEIKKYFPNIQILAGGPHPTFFPEYIKAGNFDAICIGEGDFAIKEYYDYIQKKQNISKVPNIVYMRKSKIYKNPLTNLADPLDLLPFPDREIYDKYKSFKHSASRGLTPSRGCPYNCSYCYNQRKRKMYQNLGKYVRFRSPENIIKEILEMEKKYKKLKTIALGSDTLFCNKKWVTDFLTLFAEKVNLNFVALVTANMVDKMIDEKIMALLKKSHCKGLFFGIESGNERIRKQILKKNISNENIIKLAALLKKYRIKFRTYNIIGIPTESIDEMFETIYLNIKIHTNYPWCAIFTPYPGTEIFDIAVKHGEIDKNFSFDNIPPSFMEKSILKRDDKALIENIHKFFITAVKFPFLIPLIKKLIKLKPNIIFKLWFGLTYMISIMISDKKSLSSVLLLVLKNFGFFISGHNKSHRKR